MQILDSGLFHWMPQVNFSPPLILCGEDTVFQSSPLGYVSQNIFSSFFMDLNFKAINEGIHIITDDILIVRDNSSSPGSHDYHLIQVLNKCHEIGLKLDPDKCIFKSMQVLFFGHLVTSMGLKPDPKKIKAITSMPVPQKKDTTSVIC